MCVWGCAELRKVEVSRSRVARGPFGGGLNDKVLPQMFCNLSDFSSDVDAFSIVLFFIVCVPYVCIVLCTVPVDIAAMEPKWIRSKMSMF